MSGRRPFDDLLDVPQRRGVEVSMPDASDFYSDGFNRHITTMSDGLGGQGGGGDDGFAERPVPANDLDENTLNMKAPESGLWSFAGKMCGLLFTAVMDIALLQFTGKKEDPHHTNLNDNEVEK